MATADLVLDYIRKGTEMVQHVNADTDPIPRIIKLPGIGIVRGELCIMFSIIFSILFSVEIYLLVLVYLFFGMEVIKHDRAHRYGKVIKGMGLF